MKIKTYKPESYRGCAIYYRTMRDHFEYLAIIRQELYTAHITVNPTMINRLLYLLRIEKALYSSQQQIAVVKQLRRIAETTIDWILDNKEK